MRHYKIYILILFYLSSFAEAFAQKEKQSLKEILKGIEQRYNVSFTFLDETIENIVIESIPQELSLSEVLVCLQQNTSLTFVQLDQRFIAISKPVVQNIAVCGLLVDKESQEAISGATIHYSKGFVVSNEQGYFTINDMVEHGMLTIKSFNYDSISITTKSLTLQPCKKIALTLRTSILPEVIINNYLTTGIRKLAEGSLSIQTKGLGMLPGRTEPDVLFSIQSLPGIQSIDESVSNINVRGGTHDQNLVLWEGIKMYQQGHFFGLISAFNPYFTKEVNLIKNGSSALFSDGVSSTLDIHADDEVTKQLEGGVGFNMLHADIHAKIPFSPKSSFHIATRRSIADVVETPTYQSYYTRAFKGTEVNALHAGNDFSAGESFLFYDISAKFLCDITQKDKLRVNFLQFTNSIEYQETALVNNFYTSKVSSLGQQSTAAGLSYSRQWNQQVKSSGQLYFSRYDLDAVNQDISQNQRLIQDNEVLDMGLKLDTRINLSQQIDLLSGYQFYEVGITNLEDINNPDFYRIRKTVLQTHVLFTEANYTSPSTNTAIRAGIRANLFSQLNSSRIEPRLSLVQKLNESISVDLQGEMKSQTTTQIIDFQNDFLGVEKRKWVMANNKDIPVIKSKQLSAAINFNQKNFLIVFDTYYKWVDDIITSSQGFQNQFQFIRASGGYRTYGADFLVNRRISSFNAWISYSYAQSDFTFKDLLPSGFPNNLDIRHRATMGLSYASKNLEFSTGLNWHTGKPITEPLATNALVNGRIQYQMPNASRLEDYWRVDFSAKYTFELSDKIKLMAGVSVWNMFNRDNVIDTYFQPGVGNDIVQFNRSALPLTANAMIRVEVNF